MQMTGYELLANYEKAEDKDKQKPGTVLRRNKGCSVCVYCGLLQRKMVLVVKCLH